MGDGNPSDVQRERRTRPLVETDADDSQTVSRRAQRRETDRLPAEIGTRSADLE